MEKKGNIQDSILKKQFLNFEIQNTMLNEKRIINMNRFKTPALIEIKLILYQSIHKELKAISPPRSYEVPMDFLFFKTYEAAFPVFL